MNSMQFAIQPLPCTDDQFIERVRDVADKINKHSLNSNRVFDQLKTPVQEIVIGPNHMGLLLEDGRAYRVAYSICTERLDLNKYDSTKSSTSSGINAANSNKNVAHSSRQLARSRARLMRATGRTGGQGSGSRSTGVIIGGSSNRPLVTVPATYVPEELISQAEVVLQGKSRNLIMRELQRTNLDVNLAVNNLLSRDDEEADDNEEGADNYVPEDLISLLDNGFHGDNGSVIIDPSDGLFTEEIFSNYSSIRNLLFDRIRSERNQSNSANADNNQPRTSSSSLIPNANSLSSQISSVNADREAFSRWRDRQYYGPRRWMNKDDCVWEKDADHKKKDCAASSSPIWISDELQAWPEKNASIRFKKIAALYSELIGLSVNGELHQWKWSDIEPYHSEVDNVYHPKTVGLNLTEKVVLISANFIRCSVVTENNKIATWMDEHLGYLGAKLEHAALGVNEFTMDPISSVHVCSLYSVVKTETNNVFWWGVLPFEQRRYLWEKFKTKTKKPVKTSISDLSVGSQVVMKKCPIYQTGSIGFTYVNGIPKVGQLLNSVWDFNDVSRFKILNVVGGNSNEKAQLGATSLSLDKDLKATVIASAGLQATTSTKSTSNNSNSKETTDRLDMPPPPSPASSTCSDTGSVSSHKRPKRIATKEENEAKKDEELWHLKDVVFVEDKVGPIGKVLKVDGDFVAVRFPVSNPNVTNSGSSSGGECKEDDWQQCRLLRREDVQVYKTAMTSRGPDWLQKLPKKININQSTDLNSFQLLALAVDTRGIHVVKKVASKVWYSLYNLYNSKQEQTCQFPTDCTSFIGSSANNIEMFCNNDCSGNTSTMILCDGYRAIYPLAKDCTGSIKDPQWLDLPPIKTVCMSTVSLAAIGNNLKTKVCLTAMLFESQKLMPHILRCDVKSSLAALNRIEKSEQEIHQLIDERCDGGRNVFHACTFMCAPISNKDVEEKKVPVHGVPLRVTTSTCIFANSSSSSSSVLDGNASSSSLATFSSVPVNMNPTNMSREGRTVSLREMMSRLINHDIEQQANVNSNSASSNASSDDHLYVPPWALDSESANSSDTMRNGAQDDISKFIASAVNSNGAPSKLTSTGNFNVDTMQRRDQAIMILQHMCILPSFRPFLHQLLSAKDAQGLTPFMLAVANRAYEAGLILLNTILNLAEKDPSIKESMIFPAGSPPDQSPLYVICYNDTCSFTWTGADHINQNIYECKTCGLTGSLCCCTECARVCHQGHDCKLKRTSPTAYCDCWEKCKCKALIAGNQSKRFTLLCKLASCTDLVTKFNSKGESILLFLIQTVGRQTVEQRQYRANSRIRNVGAGSTNSASRKAASDMDTDMPEHDLEPPKFARKALERLLIEWQAVRSMIMTGAESCENPQNFNPAQGVNTDSHNIYMQTQQSSTLLDKFTHNLFVKCSGEHLDTLLMTLLREMQNETISDRIKEAESVARRFVRSVARIFVIFNLEKLPVPEKRKANFSPNKHIYNCIKVFQALQQISIQELCEVAEALIAPVRLGVVRPTAPFAMSSLSVESSDDLFSVEPLAPSSNLDNMEASTLRDGSDQAGFNLQPNYSVDDVNDAQLRDGLENDDNTNRENSVHNQDDDMLDSNRNDEGVAEEESDNDNDFTFNDAETESDSDDNQSNQDAQRSVQTGATVGSETDIGVLFLEDESGDSSPQEEEGSEDGETDDHSDEFNFGDSQLERRNTNVGNRAELAPQSMQWAIRNRETVRSSVRVPSGSSLVFIDPMALRRTAAPTGSSVNTIQQENHTMATTASNLARAFGIIVRQISELLGTISYNAVKSNEFSLKLKLEDAISLQAFVETRLKRTWDWMFSVMDGTEAQLKFGAYLTNFTDPTHPLHPLNLNNQQATTTNQTNSSQVGINMSGASSRREFFSYCLSLMRAHTSEHRDSLPVLDITALRHIAYVLDSFIYYMRSDNNVGSKSDYFGNQSNLTENDDTDEEFCDNTCAASYADSAFSSATTPTTRRHSFFIRSESTLSLGCLAPEGFDLPLDVAMPLADKPHLLQPNSKREDLFANLPLLTSPPTLENTTITNTTLDYPPTKLSFSKYFNFDQSKQDDDADAMYEPSKTVITSGLSADVTNEQTESTSYYASLEDNATSSKVVDDDKIESMETDDYFKDQTLTSRPDIIIAPNKMDKSTPSKSINIVRSVIVRAGKNSDSGKNAADKKNETKANRSKMPIPLPPRGSHICNNFVLYESSPSWNFLLGRWKLALDLFGRVFMDDVGMEPGSVLPELRGFPVKEMRFRRHMEKLRNGQQRDLILCKLERNRESLIIQTFKELNTQFGTQNRRVHPPLTFNRVKVTFKDEPGEGSGVARSFYTSISEALLASAKMPNLDTAQNSSNNAKYGVPFASIMRKHGSSSRDQTNAQKRAGTGSKILWRGSRERRNLNYDARPYVPISGGADNLAENPNEHLSIHLQQLGERLYPKIHSICSSNASKITGMLLEIPTPQLLSILSSEETLRQKVLEALDIINYKQKPEAMSSSTQSKKMVPVVMVEQCPIEDNEPLFYSPGKRGFYTPRQGFGSFERVNAFRNIGRLIGLCLLQNELLPLFLQRHVLKYILSRKIRYHDLAFFDPIVYESFRQLLQSAKSESGDDFIKRMDLYFVIDLIKEEGGGTVELVPNGRELQVTSKNVFDYVKRYTEYRLVKSQEKALEALKDGVFDVLPENCMNSLSSEDLRLLLNGVGNINVSTLISYTTFNDESSEGSDKLLKFKRWFWSIVEKMNPLERQDLVYFWTGSPALPASEEGFQPLPSVTIRPADDSHLPTANTCISRLYIPLYSSKSILRSKLLLAIKSKNFGFV